MLQVDGVDVRFGGVRALNHATLDVPEGSVTGLIGPNGAGKTTLFNVVTGLQRPSSGRVLLDGADITSARPHVRARMGLARTFQRLELFGSLSARDNVQVAAEIQRGWSRTATSPRVVADDILSRVGLRAVADEQADVLPTGMARLVELGRALATKPKLLLLDEPGSGLDQSETDVLAGLLASLASDGMAVLLVEHDMELVMKVSKEISVLDFGEMIATGTPAEIQKNPAVQAAYLGTEGAADGAGPGARPGGAQGPPGGEAAAGTRGAGAAGTEVGP